MQVGDYARTKKGFIGKVNVITQYNVNIEDKKIVQLINITKTSPNIIDLIEAGDYVNGYKVDFVQNGEVIYNCNHPYKLNLMAEDIKSIVTKEQFKAMEYKVGVDKE